MTKISSRLLSNRNQYRRSVLFVSRRYFRERNVRDDSKSLTRLEIDT